MRPTIPSRLVLLTLTVALFCDVGSAQVVQLPVIRNFSVTGSASVPDGGTASLGRVGYASGQSSSAGFGPYSTRVRSGNAGGSSVSASVTIIDLAALDEAILAQAGIPQTGQAATDVSANAATVPTSVPPAVSGEAAGYELTGVAASAAAAAAAYQTPNHRRNYRSQPGRPGWMQTLAGHASMESNPSTSIMANDDLAYYLRKAKEAEQSNRPRAADVYYRLLMDHMTPELKEEYFKTVERRRLEAIAKEKEDIRRAANMKF